PVELDPHQYVGKSSYRRESLALPGVSRIVHNLNTADASFTQRLKAAGLAGIESPSLESQGGIFFIAEPPLLCNQNFFRLFRCRIQCPITINEFAKVPAQHCLIDIFRKDWRRLTG